MSPLVIEDLANAISFSVTSKLKGSNAYQIAINNKELPASTETEEYFISNLLAANQQTRIEASVVVDDTYFFSQKYIYIYTAICNLLEETQEVTPQSVATQLVKIGYARSIENEIGYPVIDFLNTLREAGKYQSADLEQMNELIGVLANFKQRRELVDIGFRIINEASELDDESAEAFVSEIVKAVSATDVSLAKDENCYNGAAMATALSNKIHNLLVGKNYYPTAIKKLDVIIGGWQPTNYVLIAGRPGTGKTAYMLTEAWRAAMSGERVVFFSLEMSAEEMATRLFCIHTGIDNAIFRNANALQAHQAAFADFVQLLNSMSDRFILYDKTGIDGDFIARTVAYENRNKDLDRVYVDYIQLLRHPNKSVIFPETVVAYNSGLMKEIALKEKIVLIAGSQLSREGEKQNFSSSATTRKPQLIDLRQSGALEQDANIVLFTYRAELYNIDIDDDGLPTKGVGLLIVRKNRGGELGEVRCHFDGKTTAWRDLVEGHEISSYSQDNSFDL